MPLAPRVWLLLYIPIFSSFQHLVPSVYWYICSLCIVTTAIWSIKLKWVICKVYKYLFKVFFLILWGMYNVIQKLISLIRVVESILDKYLRRNEHTILYVYHLYCGMTFVLNLIINNLWQVCMYIYMYVYIYRIWSMQILILVDIKHIYV